MPASLTHHKTMKIHNFTAFRDVRMDFVSGINAFVGENGTGKTHVMKSLYAFQLAAARDGDIRQILKDLFQVRELASLLRLGTEKDYAQVDGLFGHGDWAFAIHPPDSVALSLNLDPPPRPVFIPAMDMMGHTRGFLQAAQEVKLDFDRTCTDVVTLMGLERKNGSRSAVTLEGLSKLLGGEVEYDDSDSRFYLVTPVGRLPMPLVGEGLRKIATLMRLAQNGWLIPGNTLFWDEPEVNLNPKLMDEVVSTLLTLSRAGIQVFIATHSYVILKELDLQSKPTDSVRYFAFQPNVDGTTVAAFDDFALLEPNPILEQYDSLYDRELTRSTGRNRNGERVR